jgi:hypothetical protein
LDFTAHDIVLSGQFFNPSRLAGYCWHLARPAVFLGVLSASASLAGRLFSLQHLIGHLPTFARLLPTIGTVLLRAPVFVWAIQATATLYLFADGMLGAHTHWSLALHFPVYFLVLPVSGIAVVAVDQVSVLASTSHHQTSRWIDAMILATVVLCWTFVMVVVMFRWG